jgi:long-chain acyl-CoA synthetase
VPDVETVKKWAFEREIPGTLSVLCADQRVKNLILEDITRLGKQAKVKSFEQVSGNEGILLFCKLVFIKLKR